jgi:stearoyl-CoA desaturase (delta-9 desaturase)
VHLDLHPIASHFFRFWLWMTTSIVTKQWVSVHRKHHAKCETQEDPHSPVAHGIKTVLLRGRELYAEEAAKAETLKKYGHNTPDDWLETHLYTGRSGLGILLMFLIDVALFGALGITVWAVQMAWIPITAAGIINGLGHWWGYRNFEAADASTNISPGASSLVVKSCTTTTTPTRPRPSCRSSLMSSTLAGATSAAWK